MQKDDSESKNVEMIISILKAALEIEKFGIEFYHNFSTCVKEARGAALLRSLMEDEKKHKIVLEKQIAHFQSKCDTSCVQPSSEYLNIVPSRVFIPKQDSCMLLQDEINALEKGLEVERRSIAMYTEAEEKIDDPQLKRTMLSLANWEVTHRDLLEENLRLLRLDGAWYGYGPILEG
jgi:rubrerythrin